MLYLLGGTSRSGKTIIAERMLQQAQLPYLSLDWLVMGFTNGIPEYGIHDKLFPDEIAERLWSFLRAMCESMLWADLDLVIEGEAILPEHARELVDAHPDAIRVCFVGYADQTVDDKVRDVRRFSAGSADWLRDKSDAYVRDHIANMVAFSRRIRASCEEHDLRYFDTSRDFVAATGAAQRSLLADVER